MVDMETMKIKCPNCGAILIVKKVPGMESKSVPCSVCKVTNPFVKFTEVKEQSYDPEDTELKKKKTTKDDTDEEDTDFEKEALLYDTSTQKRYMLKDGLNLVGRKTYKKESVADVPIETLVKCFSRSHFYVDVLRYGVDLKLKMYLAENKNDTFVNSERIEKGEKIILQEGDVIKCSSLELKVVIR